MKYKELNDEIRKIIADCIEEDEIDISDEDWGVLEKTVASDVCGLIMRNFKELEF